MRNICRIRQSKVDNIFDIFNYIIMALIFIFYAYPIIFIISASISNPNLVWNGEVWLFPKDISFLGYERIFKQVSIWVGYKNTLIYTFFGTILNLFMTVTAAYPLSHRSFYPRKVLMGIYVFTMYFGGGLIPTYLLVKSMNLINTPYVMIVLGAVGITNIIITRTYFATSIPFELNEAAEIDGCTNFNYLIKIVLPLSKPILAIMALYYGVAHWNNFFSALIYLTKPNLYPLQLVLRSILLEAQMSSELIGIDSKMAEETQVIVETMKYGIIIVATVPVLLVYPFIQKHFIKGVMIGSVKG